MSADLSHVRFISAGAGSGKTYRLTEELERALVNDGIEPGRVIGTTFTVKAAAELRERVQERLIRSGRPALAEQSAQALIGTVHSVCERLLARFAFELGLSPELSVASLEDCGTFFHQALDETLSVPRVRRMNAVAAQLEIEDWRADVKALVDRARDNDIGPHALAAMGPASADALLALFPPPESGDWDEKLFTAVRRALDAIDLSADTTKTTAKYVDRLKAAIYRLRRPPCPWAVWMGLADASAAKRSEPVAARVRLVAGAYERHPRFHADVRGYIEGVYAIAADTLERFQAIKTERGLIDFPDMEQLTLRALDDAAVRARLEQELGLLLVDEFQDTNPMQLAIFMKLAPLADKVVFVGDVKQAIYAFRGCDPDLVFETLAALAAGGSEADVLPYSWRSRAPLVEYVNAVFCRAFEGEIPAAEVRLDAKRADETGEPAVLHWSLDGNAERRAGAIARGIIELLESGYRVVDAETRTPRPARFGDVAVLAATNDQVEEIAKALRAAHVPMKMTLRGLLGVPEVCLAKACLRRLNDVTDTLATAEIVAMAECDAPEVWLGERLEWLANESESFLWGETTHPIVAKLAHLRADIGTQSPVEIVARVLNYVGIREVVAAWGPSAIKAMQRQRNLDALLNLAVEYEKHCDAQHQAATLTGFLFWLEHPHSPELDLQPAVTTGDAVHVLTYHRAKGLEWPIVVAAELHYSWRSRLWDVRVERAGEFELLDPLAGRSIGFWPGVLGKRTRAPLHERIAESDIGTAAVRQAEAESRRLAYVGLTRARDALVLGVPARNVSAGSWLSAFAGPDLLPAGERLALTTGNEIATRYAEIDTEPASMAPPGFAPRRLPERAPLADVHRERLSPSAAAPLETAEVLETVDLGARVKLNGDDMTAIGMALHAVIAAEILQPDREDALARARALLEAYGVAAFIDAAETLAAARRFRSWLDERFQPRRVLVEQPITQRLEDGRVVHGWIDLLVETDAGWVVIDHKSSPRPKCEWPVEALEHSGQLAVYRDALEACGERVAGCWIHFAVSGGMAALGATASH